MNKLTLFLIVVLSGCATSYDVKPNDPVIAPETTQVNVPKEQLTPCPDLPAPDLKALTQKETLDLLGAWFTQYTACQLPHNALITTVKKAFNVQD